MKRELKKIQTKHLILNTAKDLFAEKGFSSVKTLDIAKKANVSHGCIFAHFKSRENLLESVIESFGISVAAGISDSVKVNASLKEVLQAHLNCLIKIEPFYTRLICEITTLPPKAYDSLAAIQSAISYHLSYAISKEQKDGMIKVIEPYWIFNTWIGLIHHYLINRKIFSPEGSVIKRYQNDFISNLLKLLKK